METTKKKLASGAKRRERCSIRVGKAPVRKASDYRPQSQAEQEQENRTINAMFRATWEGRE